MKYKKILIITSLIILLILLAWSPWITKNYAETSVLKKFNQTWYGVNDGCGFNCNECGIKDSHKTLFGYIVKIEYDCGMTIYNPYINSKPKQDNIYVSPLGQVYGL